MYQLTMVELDAGLPSIAESPKDAGRLELIVRRPAVGEREVLAEGELDTAVGLVGDTWHLRGSSRMPDRSPHPDMQINIMNARAAALVAGSRDRWPLAGDQLYVDLDLSPVNLPPGTWLAIGPRCGSERGFCTRCASRIAVLARRRAGQTQPTSRRAPRAYQGRSPLAGSAVLEVTAQPHTGCDKFVSQFGIDATKFVNSPTGRAFNLRGINARVVVPGRIRPGDIVQKIPAAAMAGADGIA